MNRSRSSRIAIAIYCVTASLLAACTTSKNVGGSPSTATLPPSSAATTPSGSATTTPSGSQDPAIPTETGPADKSLAPVTIGSINMDSGVPSLPGVTAAYDVAVQYINDKLGGIGGHPVRIERCNVGLDTASNERCAAQLANDKSVSVAAVGLALGSPALYPIAQKAGLPLSIMLPLLPQDFVTEAGVSYYSGNANVVQSLPYFAIAKLHAKKIILAVADNPGGKAAIPFVMDAPIVKQSGASIKTVLLPDNAPDVTGKLIAGGISTADALILSVTSGTCIQVANALRQLNSKVAVTAISQCDDPAVTSAVGDKVKGWYISNPGVSPLLAPGQSPQVDFARGIFEHYGKQDSFTMSAAGNAFGQILALWKIGNRIGFDNLTRASWNQGIRAFTGAVLFGPDSVKCPGDPYPAICSNTARVSVIGNNAQEKIADDGKPINPGATG